MTANKPGSCEWLANEIAISHLMERSALDPVVNEFRTENTFADATALAEHLVKIGKLTTYQATRLLEGQGRGLVLGPYVLVDVVGAGSLGTVYKALGRADQKAYAIKVLPVRSPWNVRQARKRLQQFPQEAHPAVVPWLDVGTSAGLHYLVWPFAEGETLEANIHREGLLAPARAAAIGVQLGHAIQWCEQHRVWHGAIKPSNVLLGRNGQAQLLDFGIGELLAGAEDESLADTKSVVLASLVDCTAPECAADPSKRSVRGDQYSLGCTLYYGLTGRYPFPNGTPAERLEAHQRLEPTPVSTLNPGVPPALAAAIDRLMQKAPEARYNHTDELVSALTPLARQSAVYVPPPPAPAPSPLLGYLDTPSRASASLLTAQTPWPKTPTPAITRTPRPSMAKPLMSPPVAVHPAQTTPPAEVHRPVAIERNRPDALPNTPPPERPFVESVKRKLMFWKTWEDPVACTLLAPSGVLPGETATVQVVVHHTSRSEQARTLPDWRGTQELPQSIERGDSLGFNLTVRELEIGKPLGQVAWNGFSTATMFTLRVPPDWPPGQTLQGTLTIGRQQVPLGMLQFELPVASGQGSS